MDGQTLLVCLAATAPAVASVLDHWHKWREKGMHGRAYITVASIALSIALTWTVVPLAARKHRNEVQEARNQTAQARRDAAGQIEKLQEQLRVQAQDSEARQLQQEKQLKLIANCIPDRALRKQAQSLGVPYKRDVKETLKYDDKASAIKK